MRRLALTLRRRLRPGLFALQMGSVGVAGLVLGVIALVTLSLPNSTYQRAIVVGEAAQLTAAIEAATDYVALLLEAEHRPGGDIAFTPVITARVYEQIKFQRDVSLRLTEIVDSPEVERLRQLVEAEEVAFLRFPESGDLADFTAIHNIQAELHDLAEELVPALTTEALADGEHASRLASGQAWPWSPPWELCSPCCPRRRGSSRVDGA